MLNTSFMDVQYTTYIQLYLQKYMINIPNTWFIFII